MEIYSRNQDTAFAYRELLGLEPLIKYELAAENNFAALSRLLQ